MPSKKSKCAIADISLEELQAVPKLCLFCIILTIYKIREWEIERGEGEHANPHLEQHIT